MAKGTVVVVGAGSAGVAAALAASASARVILLDERDEPGGHGRRGADARRSTDARAALDAAGVDYRPSTSVWALLPGPAVGAYNDDAAFELTADAVVVASGAIERSWPVPGWEKAGVLTAEAVRAGGVEPGQRVGVVEQGGDIDAAIADIEAAGGQVAYRTADLTSARIAGGERAERLEDAGGGADVDAVVLVGARVPDPALVLQARAESRFLRDALIEMPLIAEDGATALPGVFLAGEAAGVAADDAEAHGRLAGEAAAAIAAGGTQRVPTGTSLPGVPVSALPAPRDADTLVCREQGVDVRAVEAAIEGGAYDVNDLRKITRAGMGLGQGRDALAVLAAILMAADPSISDERLTGRVRPPARPIPFRVALNAIAAD
jgi:hypothetical protein